MSKTFKANVTTSFNATVDACIISHIIEEEIDNLLGDVDRYIENGVIKESDYRCSVDETIRKATKEEIELYHAMRLVSKHFKSL